MSKAEEIQGIWRVIASEVDGQPESKEAIDRKARLIILPDVFLPDSDGMWGIVQYLEPLSADEKIQLSINVVKKFVTTGIVSEASNVYVYTAGILYLGEENDFDSVDFRSFEGPHTEHLLRSQSLEPLVVPGIYEYDGTHLTICSTLPTPNCQRPTAFISTQSLRQSVWTYVREHVI